ncbi:hypothetical protein C3L33_08537, partial [Rhododendron williamsianum]
MKVINGDPNDKSKQESNRSDDNSRNRGRNESAVKSRVRLNQIKAAGIKFCDENHEAPVAGDDDACFAEEFDDYDDRCGEKEGKKRDFSRRPELKPDHANQPLWACADGRYLQEMHGSDGFTVGKSIGEIENGHNELLIEAELVAAAEEKETHSFEIHPAQVDLVQSFETDQGHLQDRMARGKEEYNAFFYSLVSTDTQVITSLPPPDSGANLSYHGLTEQLAVLGKVLSAADDAVGLELLEEDDDDVTLHKSCVSMKSMSAMSGASGMVYMEYKYGYFLSPFLGFDFSLCNISLSLTGRHEQDGKIKSKPQHASKRHHPCLKDRFA